MSLLPNAVGFSATTCCLYVPVVVTFPPNVIMLLTGRFISVFYVQQ